MEAAGKWNDEASGGVFIAAHTDTGFRTGWNHESSVQWQPFTPSTRNR